MEELSYGQHSTELDGTTDQHASIDGDFSSAFATAGIPPDVLKAAEIEKQEILARNPQNFGYSSSSSSSPRHSVTDNILEDVLDDDGCDTVQSTTSSRSSISSLPGSIVIHPMNKSKALASSDLQVQKDPDGMEERYESPKAGTPMRYAAKIRDRNSPFRHPSSVRAMQLHTEDEDEDFVSPSRLRGGVYRGSPSSIRSAGSSPTKRPGYYSANGTPKKQPVKKEYPLVLLHCNLLPPTLPLPPGVGIPSRKLLEEILPPQYWKRWKLLEEKLIGSGVLRDRGVLISHPQEMYDLLEERLLESLELERPRLRNGHFLGHDDPASGKEDDGDDFNKDSEDEEEGEECPDCGGRVIRHDDTSRKWEVKVYAANGLLKAGAWAAAWREMEKVDVEVGLWLPSSVRRDLERRILEEEVVSLEEDLKAPQAAKGNADENRQAVSQEQIDGLDDMMRSGEYEFPPSNPEVRSSSPEVAYGRKTATDIELQTLLINYIRLLASDKRNVAVAFLSVLVLFLAITGGARPTSASSLISVPPEIAGLVETPAVTAAQYLYTSSSSSLSSPVQIATESPAVHVQVQETQTEPSIVHVDLKQTPIPQPEAATEPEEQEQTALVVDETDAPVDQELEIEIMAPDS
jgi:hypothetical protein